MTAGAGAEIQTKVYVMEGEEESLLGQEDAEALGIIAIRAEGAVGPVLAREKTPRETEPDSGRKARRDRTGFG